MNAEIISPSETLIWNQVAAIIIVAGLFVVGLVFLPALRRYAGVPMKTPEKPESELKCRFCGKRATYKTKAFGYQCDSCYREAANKVRSNIEDELKNELEPPRKPKWRQWASFIIFIVIFFGGVAVFFGVKTAVQMMAGIITLFVVLWLAGKYAEEIAEAVYQRFQRGGGGLPDRGVKHDCVMTNRKTESDQQARQ